MATSSDDRLDRLLRDSYPAVEVSPDFTLRLWRKLIGQPEKPLWKLPVPALAAALAVGILTGIRTASLSAPVVQLQEWSVFGNAPLESVAGSVLALTQGENL